VLIAEPNPELHLLDVGRVNFAADVHDVLIGSLDELD
jgi:hypothetical protein